MSVHLCQIFFTGWFVSEITQKFTLKSVNKISGMGDNVTKNQLILLILFGKIFGLHPGISFFNYL